MKLQRVLILLVACLSGGLLYAQIPANDACINATIVSTFPFTDTLDATGATNNEGSIIVEECSDMNDGVWYNFLGTGTDVTVSFETEDFDGEIGIYSGNCDNLQCVASVDESFVQGGETVTLSTVLGRPFFVNIGYWDNVDGPEGEITVQILSDTLALPLCGALSESEGFTDQALITLGTQQIAADFIVSANFTEGLDLTEIRANFIAVDSLAQVNITFFEDNNGLPGPQFGAIITDPQISQTMVGENSGFNFIELSVTLPETILFPHNSINQRYWMRLEALGSDDTFPVGWELTPRVKGSPYAFINSDDTEGEWLIGDKECVFVLVGDCELIEGCFAPNSFHVSTLGTSEASLVWSSSVVPESYQVELYNSGKDPSTTDPFQTFNIAPSENFVDITSLTPGDSYDAYITTVCNEGESISLSLSFTTKLRPVNDDVCSAIALTVGEGCSNAAYNNTDATVEENEPAGICFIGDATKTVWFSFIAPLNGSARISSDILPATLTDTEIALYKAPDICEDLSTLQEPIACAQDEGDLIEFNSVLVYNDLFPGETYYIQVSGFKSEEGSFCIEVLEANACPASSGLTTRLITEDGVQFIWDEQSAAQNGYVFSVFENGVNPTAEEPIFSETLVTDERFISVSGLAPGTTYDAYVNVDCGDSGISSFQAPYTFRTIPSNPVCGEIILDSGGDSLDYQNDEFYTYVIEALDSTSIITLSVAAVDLEEGFDFLRVFEGEGEDAVEISDEEDGITAPGDYSTSDPGSVMTITFESDLGGTAEGWVASVNCTGVSGVAEIDELEFSISPNPVTEIVTISSSSTIQLIEVYSTVGERVLYSQPGSSIFSANVSTLASGTYLIKTLSEGKVGTRKFLKL